jgi:hypothetical protein
MNSSGDQRAATAGQVLATLAALAPDSKPTIRLDTPDADMRTVPISYTRMFEQALGRPTFPAKGMWHAIPTSHDLLKRAQLHDDENVLRLGWLWVHGLSVDRARVHYPLVSMPVRRAGSMGLFGDSGQGAVQPVGEPELTELVTDPVLREQLESSMEFGGGALDQEGVHADPALLTRLARLSAWTSACAAAAGFPAAPLVPRRSDLNGWPAKRCEVVATVQLFIADTPQRQVTVASTLRSWEESGLDATALAAAYGVGATRPAPTPTDADPVRSSIVLSPAQAQAVARARTDPVTVVSGPPGSGKTQAIAAIALDTVERGESVLVAAPSDAAVEALITLMNRVPGPDPIVFGANQERLEVADRLGQGGGPLVDDSAVTTAEAARDRATVAAEALRATVRELLAGEQLAGGADPASMMHARRIAPAWFQPGADLDKAQRLLDRARSTSGLFSRFRRRRREQRVLHHADGVVHDIGELASALETARAARSSQELESSGGLDLTDVWPRLIEAEEQRRVAHGRWLNAWAHSHRRVSSSARTTMGVVAAALRAGRSARRQRLGEIDGRQLADALPLWIGTLRDIDDLLPRTPAMFDLVVIDEASQVDQIGASPALLRARRAVVVGDPKQLRHVSFLADETVQAARAANGVDDALLAGLLDVRRLSAFDLTAAAAPTILLDEHYRSAPHLIGFSARHFYDGKVSIATTHPRNHDRDCISVEGAAGARDEQGVNIAEIDRTIAIVRARLARARESGTPVRVGIVTPFRAQADAIERRVIDEFSLDEIDELALRVGTVHGFQGCERDLVIISLALNADSPASSRGFVADANLFNVMITRAREEVVVVTCLPPDTDGIVGDYIRYGSSPPTAPGQRGAPSARAHAIAAELARSGLPAAVNYPAGRHTLDLVIGAGEAAAGVTLGVHPDGPDAHIERRIALHRAGWEVREAFDTRWRDRLPELTIELVLESQRRVPS